LGKHRGLLRDWTSGCMPVYNKRGKEVGEGDMHKSSLLARGIEKGFDGVQALKGVEIELIAGEIHGLVGENGAGKSTLIKIIGGALQADKGEIILDGSPIHFKSPRDSMRHGIVVIHQDPPFFHRLSVMENILMGHLPSRLGLIRWEEARRGAESILEGLGISLPLNSPLEDLSAAQRQLVAIAYALSLKAKWLILDEPTSSLSISETNRLFEVLRILRDQGMGLLFVSHRLEEVMELCDRITVLRDGMKCATLHAGEAKRDILISLMVGDERIRGLGKEGIRKGEGETGKKMPILRLHGIKSGDEVNGVDLEVMAGEILGLFGLVGSGRSELAQAIVGLRKIEEGHLEWKGRALWFKSPRDAMEAGIAYLPEDRLRHGLLLSRNIRENIGLPILQRISGGGVVKVKEERRISQEYVRDLRIVARTVEQPVSQLSGGNQQKVVLAKWLPTNPELLILDEPTHGVDVATKAEIHTMIQGLKDRGKSILLISSELPELISLSDRIAVMRDGKVVGEFSPDQPQDLMLSAAFGEMRERKEGGRREEGKRWRKGRELSILLFIAALSLMVGIRNIGFVSPGHWLDMLSEAAPTLLAAGAMAAIIISGNLDLSVGSMLGACAMAAGKAAKEGIPIPLAMAIAPILGSMIGLTNGLLTVKLGIPSVVVTLGMLGIIRGAMLIFTKGYWVVGLPEGFRWIGTGKLLGIPMPVIVSGIFLLVLWILLRHSIWGRELYAMGCNQAAARLVGIPIGRRTIEVFALGGALTGFAALIYAARFPVIQSETGKGFELTVITAAVLGGVNIFGGAGSAIGAALGAFAVTVLHSALTFLHMPGEWDLFALGGLILISIAADSILPSARGGGRG